MYGKRNRNDQREKRKTNKIWGILLFVIHSIYLPKKY